MSLIHWWPLNGDTKNYGTSGEQVTESNVTYTSGKVGQSMYKGKLNFTAEQWKNTIGNTISIAMWIYTREDGTYSAGTPFFGNGGMTAPNNRKFTMFHYPAKTTLHCSWQNDDLTSSDNPNTYLSITYANFFEIGKWIHLCVVQDAKTETVTVYKNGTQYSKINVTGLATMNFKSAAAAPIRNNIDYQQINDLRIYDHALSQAEVKELSRALVVHYTFDDILAEPTTNVSTINGWNAYTSYFVISERTAMGLKVYRPTNSTNTVLALSNSAVTGQMSAGEVWTFSCYLYVNGQPYKCTQPDMSTYKYSGISYYSNDDGYYTCTFTVVAPETWIIHAPMFGSVGTNVMCEIDRIQFEKKDHATPYTSSTRASMIRNEAETIQPSTVSNVILTTDSASGSYSLKCAGSTYLNHSPLGDTSTGATASMWIKNMDVTGQIVAFADANSQLAFGPYGSYCCIGCVNGTNKRRALNVSSLWKADEWNHVVVKKDSSNTYYCYINGVETTYGNTDYWTHSTYLTIGARYSSGYSRQFTGLIDDFRLYHTCLTAEEIQDLYKARALITDKGDIETHQFIEGKTQAQVTSKYCFETNECYEDFEVGSDYERIEYIEFSETQYIDTGLAFTDASVPIIIEADIVKTRLSGNDCLAGCGNGAWSGPVMLNCHNGTCEFGVNGYATASDGSGSITANERLIIRAELGTKKEEHFWYKNGQKINLGTKAYNDRTSSSSTLYIGAFHVGTSVSIASGSCWIGRLYSFKVWYGGSSRILVPAKRKSDSAFGLYDMAEHNFYSNIGGGSLSGGPIINSSEAKIYQDQHILGRNIIEI